MALTTAFVGIDADAIGNGDADETLAIDTWLQRRIQYNTQYLLAPEAGLCWSPISGSGGTWTSYTGIRPYAAFKWHTIWTGRVQVLKDQTAIEFVLAYHSDVPGSTSTAGNIEVAVTLGDGASTKSSPATLASTYSSGIKTGHQTVSVNLAARAVEDTLMSVSIWVRSVFSSYVASTIGDSGTGQTTTMYHVFPYRLRDSDAAGTRYFSNSTGTPPDATSLETMFILQSVNHPDWPNSSGRTYDLLYSEEIGAQGSAAGTLGEVLQNALNASTCTAYRHQCFMLRAVFMRPVFGSSTVKYAHSAIIPASVFAPHQELGSAEAMKQAAAVIRAYRQPTVALIGPKGVLHDTAYTEQDLDSFAAQGYAVHWPTIMGDFDDATSGQSTALVNEGLYLRTENPRLEILCTWLSVQHGATWGRNAAAGQEDVSDKDKVRWGSEAGSALWDMTVSLHQLADKASAIGDWTTDITEYGSLSTTVEIPVYGADVLGAVDAPPVMRGTDSVEQTGKSSSAGAGFWFKEGSLFDEDMASGVLCQTRHTISTSSLTQTETLKPFRLKINMDLNEFTDPLSTDTATASADLRLTLVSVVVIEHPEDP